MKRIRSLLFKARKDFVSFETVSDFWSFNFTFPCFNLTKKLLSWHKLRDLNPCKRKDCKNPQLPGHSLLF